MSDINKLRNRVNSLAQGIFEDSQLSEDGSLWISYESTLLNLSVTEAEDALRDLAEKFEISKTQVAVRAMVLVDVKISDKLNETVAQFTPTDFLPGVSLYIALNDDGKTGNVIACSILSADDLDESELRTALISVALTANYLDDEMQKEFGGSKVSD